MALRSRLRTRASSARSSKRRSRSLRLARPGLWGAGRGCPPGERQRRRRAPARRTARSRRHPTTARDATTARPRRRTRAAGADRARGRGRSRNGYGRPGSGRGDGPCEGAPACRCRRAAARRGATRLPSLASPTSVIVGACASASCGSSRTPDAATRCDSSKARGSSTTQAPPRPPASRRRPALDDPGSSTGGGAGLRRGTTSDVARRAASGKVSARARLEVGLGELQAKPAREVGIDERELGADVVVVERTGEPGVMGTSSAGSRRSPPHLAADGATGRGRPCPSEAPA